MYDANINIDKKYLIFSPWRAGLSNVLMSYELILGIAQITGRTLILNKSDYVDHIGDLPKSEWLDIWGVLNSEELNKQFNVIDIDLVPELNDKIELMATCHSHTFKASEVLEDIYSYQLNDLSQVDQICFINGVKKYQNDTDFQLFTMGRNVIDLNRPEKFLHFEANLFGYFWYQIYPGGPQERNRLKKSINQVMTYNSHFDHCIDDCLKIIGSSFNAVHVRRNDFLSAYSDSLKNVNSISDLVTQLSSSFSNDLPLYIATDEQDINFFQELKKIRKIFTYNDLNLVTSPLESAIIEQLICSKARHFLGTIPSTFSKRINIIRGLNGLHANDHIGVNHIIDSSIKFSSPLPWVDHSNPSHRWHWFSSCYPQWNYESI